MLVDEAELAAQSVDPRSTIIRLYAQLLSQLGPRVGSISSLTAEEIRVGPLRKLGVSPQAATVLTRLFEAARYSPHPVESEAEGRFGEAFQIVEQGLVSRAVAG